MRLIDYLMAALLAINIAYSAYMGNYDILGWKLLATIYFANMLKLRKDIRGLHLLLRG